MKREVRIASVLLVLALSATAASQPTDRPVEDAPEPGSLSYYIAMAHELSPAAEQARMSLEAAEARADVAGSLPDPMVTYGHYFEEVETRVGPQVARFGVRQMIPLFGKRGLARSAAEHRAESASARTQAALLDVEVNVTRAFADYAYLARAVEITQERLRLLESLEEVVRTRYASGEVPYSDVMRARIALARMDNALASHLDRRATASSMLAAAVGLPDDQPLPWPTDIPYPEGVSEDSALERFTEDSPDLRMLDSDVEAADSERKLAGRSYLPDLTLGLDYIVTDEAAMPVPESGKDPIIGMATIDIPLWFGKHSAGIKAAEASLRAAERRREQRANELRAGLRSALFELADARRRVELYRDSITPAAEQSLAAADEAYKAGSADFDALIGAHETVLEFRLAEQRARADVLIRSAELARKIGATGVEELE
jgi:cobalt-zinc-cadmium efflux system outer membrane protein